MSVDPQNPNVRSEAGAATLKCWQKPAVEVIQVRSALNGLGPVHDQLHLHRSGG